jgi:hypothetical protein
VRIYSLYWQGALQATAARAARWQARAPR